MPLLTLLRSRDPVAALLALLVLAAILAGPPRDVIRLKDASQPITISLAAPPEEAALQPVQPPLPQPPHPQPPKPAMRPHPAPRAIGPLAPETTKEATAEPVAQIATAPAAAAPPVPPPPAAPTRPPAPVVAMAAPRAPNLEASYVARLRGYLESIKRYPTTREARSMRPQGRVRVWLEIERGGALRDAGIDESSGSMILDAAALATVRQGTYPPFPGDTWSGQSSHRFEVTLEYSLAG